MPQIQDCKRELREILASSQQTSEPHIVLSAGELHKRVFGETNPRNGSLLRRDALRTSRG